MLEHHAFHILLTVVALAAIGAWWFYQAPIAAKATTVKRM